MHLKMKFLGAILVHPIRRQNFAGTGAPYILQHLRLCHICYKYISFDIRCAAPPPALKQQQQICRRPTSPSTSLSTASQSWFQIKKKKQLTNCPKGFLERQFPEEEAGIELGESIGPARVRLRWPLQVRCSICSTVH